MTEFHSTSAGGIQHTWKAYKPAIGEALDAGVDSSLEHIS